MSEKPEMKHLDSERLSVLLDDPGGHDEASAHLEACESCRAEFEALSRMRMALSGLGPLQPPRAEWERIAKELEGRGVLAPLGAPTRQEERGFPADARPGATAMRAGVFGYLTRWPLQAAAAFLLFAGGILAGLQLTAGGSGDTDASTAAPGMLAGRDGGGAASAMRMENDRAAYVRQALAELERLGAPAATEAAGVLDPASAAERLARLDAVIGAAREAVRENPADPVANALLFRLVEQRDELASRLNQSLHLATLEYR